MVFAINKAYAAMSAAMLPNSGGAYQLADGAVYSAPSPGSIPSSSVPDAGLAVPLQIGQGTMSLSGLVAHAPTMYVSHVNSALDPTTAVNHVGQAEEIRTIFVTGFPPDVHARELHNLV